MATPQTRVAIAANGANLNAGGRGPGAHVGPWLFLFAAIVSIIYATDTLASLRPWHEPALWAACLTVAGVAMLAVWRLRWRPRVALLPSAAIVTMALGVIILAPRIEVSDLAQRLSARLAIPGVAAPGHAETYLAEVRQYYRARSSVVGIRSTPAPARDSDARIADEVMAGRFAFLGRRPEQLPSNLAWNENPANDRSWAWELHRMGYLTPVWQYSATGDAAYLQRAEDLVLDWIEDNLSSLPVRPPNAWPASPRAK